MIAEVLNILIARAELPADKLRAVLQAMMAGACGDVEAAAFLVALRMKGETAAELATAAQVLREHMIRWDPGCPEVLDTCGTGGDGQCTFNISTAAALIVAGCGVPVVKHGNRSVSSRSGSADVLTALGVKVDGDAADARACLREAGFAFCFAPNFHPALKHVGPVRRRLGVPTLFNCLGPLANPAGAKRQLLGVGRLELLDRMAGALAMLGAEHAVLVRGADGLDEVSLAGPTHVREVRGDTVRAAIWTPADFGLAPCAAVDLHAADAAASAQMIEDVLHGADSPALRVSLANAAAALLAAHRATTLPEGVALARHAVATGQAAAVLAKLRARSAAVTTVG